MTLDAQIETVFRLSPSQRKALYKLRVTTVEDLLYHFPTRYGDAVLVKTIATLQKGDSAAVYGTIGKLKTSKAFFKKIPMAEGVLDDGTGKIKIIWFNQPYLAKMIAEGALVRAEGKVSERRKSGALYFSNPKIERVNSVPEHSDQSLFENGVDSHHLYPVYPESRGVTSNWLYHAVQKILKTGVLETRTDPIPQDILAKYHLPSLKTALIWIHAPQKESDAVAARKRFAFEEVFLIQLEKQKERRLWQKEKSFTIEKGEEHIAHFTKRFPFSFTNAQNRAISGILEDFRKGLPMARLLEGDVGSGKTAVAATTAYAVVTSRPKGQSYGTLQVAYMCPTEILAKQQFENFISFFSHLPINIGLITSSGCRKFASKMNPHEATDMSRAQLLKWVTDGEISILVGTHSLIQKSVKFKHLAYVIIDEQHRFGVAQRKALVRGQARTNAPQGGERVSHPREFACCPHLLSMTATPIPRTLSLTIYGDLDLTLLDELPPGRKPIITEIVPPEARSAIYEKIRKELHAGRQTYVITPRIDEPDPAKEFAMQAKSAKAEAARLKKDVFPEYRVGVMHGKLKDGEKEDVMEDFKDGKINILVSTSVVEVGVNVENATVIVIEGAERFGLAQLHQLRGRVLRSTRQAYCFVFTESGGKDVLERLRALQEAKNGFELAEYDLKFRGAGELSGAVQWGVSDVAMEALKNLKMVEAARFEAGRLLEEDETLAGYPFLLTYFSLRGKKIHFE
ncbi:MAG TPA: DNA helicase RecG [Candidatus Taylorbacteria bacterium]|nr:DNA helicase RecG [Candidatus Taylorbacteria bacterium]